MIDIPGLTQSFKVPGSRRVVNYGRGRRSVGDAPIKLVVTGTKTSAGSATPDQDIVRVYTDEDADALVGPGSESAWQCYAALRIPGVNLYVAPVAENGSATAGTMTITIAGSWSTASTGTLTIWLAGKAFSVTVTPAMSATNVAAALVLAINGDSRMFCTASNASGVVTLTTKSKGVRMNQWLVRKDVSLVPAGLTCTLAGGTARTGGITPFANGAGADDVTTMLGLLAADRWHIQAWAQNDATNAALIRTQLNSEAGSMIMHNEHAVMAMTGSTSTSASFAATTLNNQRMTLVHLTNCEWHPSALAAIVAAVRSVTIGKNPNARYNGVELPGVPPQSQRADIASDSVNDTLLNSGTLPLTTTQDGRVLIVRAIQSHCLNGSSPDFRTLDWGQADVPDRISDNLGARWEEHSEANPYLSDEPDPSEDAPGEEITWPSRWNGEVMAEMKDAEKQKWVQDVDANPSITEFQTDRLMTAVPCIVRLQNHIVGIAVNQTAAS